MWAWLKFKLATFLKGSNFSGNFEQLVDRAREVGLLLTEGKNFMQMLLLPVKQLKSAEYQNIARVENSFFQSFSFTIR